ncbi:MAG: type II toxin-antitoxin system RelE/ParE family toxin [archaeon]
MSFEVVFDPEAIDFLNKLEKSIKERIYNKIMAASANPFHFFERLAERPEYKLRVGDYRVIVDINQSDKKVEVTLIGHRKDVYSKLNRS